jgi:hypothetical protein
MADLVTVRKKFKELIGGLEERQERINAQLGDGKGLVNVQGRIGFAHIRLEDGTYYGVVFNNKVPFENDLPVVVGYSHEQPELFQVLEARSVAAATSPGVPAGQIGDVTGLAAVWQQDDVLIAWTPLAPSALFHNYQVTIVGATPPEDVRYLTSVPYLTYTRGMNQADHGGTWADELDISVVAVDIYGSLSLAPATLNTTWTRPTLPNCANGTAEWNNDDVLFRWDDIVKPYTFSHYLVTIITSASIAYVATTNLFVYTNELNRIDNGGVPDAVVQAEVVAVDRDGYTSFLPLVINSTNSQPTGDTIEDNFDTYGGDEVAQNGNAALYWLSLVRSEGDTAELDSSDDLGSAVRVAGHNVEGSYAWHLENSGSDQGRVRRVASFDLGDEGRFSSGDYMCLYVEGGFYAFVRVMLVDVLGKTMYADFYAEENQLLALPQSAFTTESGFDSTQIASINLELGDSDIGEAYFDDLRIVKSDPDNSLNFNDTGTAWDFSGGVWHIYQDVPGVPYALGQVDVIDPTRDTALRMGNYVASNHFALGVYLREAGAAGLLAFAQDDDDTYEVKLDTTSNTVSLRRWIGGASNQLGAVFVTVDPLVKYNVGVMRNGNFVDVFFSSDASPIFSAPNLIMHVSDTTYLIGKAGAVAYGVNARFFHMRAGSPEHALTAEFAYQVDLAPLDLRYLQISMPPTIVSTNTTLATEKIVMVSNGSTITLPTAVGRAGTWYNIIRTGTASVLINTTGGQTISGDVSLTLPFQYDSICVISDGTNWMRFL